ncbi:YbaB/EbfC family nucleoid-associated protein [Gordonia sp. CPCC 205515]|uniref:YbaB/EbfC family nucleoid-associated protein n=1 Tax=Gordonia sp. CPCC 205515 TaxID=3140791 RepID=UPI003AF33625
MSWAMDELEARARRQLDSLNSVSERMASVRVSERSPDGEVLAVVDGNGALIDLEFSDRISMLTGKQLEQLVVATANVACQKAFASRAQIIEEFNAEFADLVAPPEAAGSASTE